MQKEAVVFYLGGSKEFDKDRVNVKNKVLHSLIEPHSLLWVFGNVVDQKAWLKLLDRYSGMRDKLSVVCYVPKNHVNDEQVYNEALILLKDYQVNMII